MADIDLAAGRTAMPVYLIDPVARTPYSSAGIIIPETWTNPASSWDVRQYGDVEVQVVGTPSTPYQLTFSLDGTNYVNVGVMDATFASVATIAAAGTYYLKGRGYLKFSAGAGSTLTRRAAA